MPSDEMLSKIPKPFVLVIDDMMGEIDAGRLAGLFTKKSHHNNFTVVFLSQNLFDKSMRVPRTNAQYIFLMRAPVFKLHKNVLIPILERYVEHQKFGASIIP